MRSSPILVSAATAALLALVSTAASVIGPGRNVEAQTSALVAGARDPAYWPFDRHSPWNQPIGRGAQYAAITSPAYKASGGVKCFSDAGSFSIVLTRPVDRAHKVMRHGAAIPLARVPLPPGLVQLEDDLAVLPSHLLLIDPAHQYVLELLHPKLNDQADLHAVRIYRNALHGPGFYTQPHGLRASGASGLGGLIRRGELGHGIPHALAASVRGAALNRQGDEGQPYVWPACGASPGWEKGYATEGNLFMGSLIAIPPEVELDQLELADPAAYRVARALQDYGAYVVDVGSHNLAFYVESDAAVEVPADFEASLGPLAALVQVVTSNTRTSVGGGGEPRRPLAPPLIEHRQLR